MHLSGNLDKSSNSGSCLNYSTTDEIATRNTTAYFLGPLCMCAYHCGQMSYTTQHRTVLIIFPLNLQTNITAEMQSTGDEGSITE